MLRFVLNLAALLISSYILILANFFVCCVCFPEITMPCVEIVIASYIMIFSRSYCLLILYCFAFFVDFISLNLLGFSGIVFLSTYAIFILLLEKLGSLRFGKIIQLILLITLLHIFQFLFFLPFSHPLNMVNVIFEQYYTTMILNLFGILILSRVTSLFSVHNKKSKPISLYTYI